MSKTLTKVGYDAGHGGYKDEVKKLYATAGKRTPDGEPEWEFNNIVARAFANQLALYDNVASKRFDDSTGKTDVPLEDRTDRANDWGADYYLSFHQNAYLSKWGTHTGVETYYKKGNAKSLALAEAIHPAVVAAYGLRNRGLKDNNLHITREMKCPAILIEGGFMDSTIDIKKLRDTEVLQKAGRDIADAFAKFVGLKKTVVVSKPTPAPTPSTNIPSTSTPKADEKYVVAKSVSGYINAANAKDRKAKASTIKAGTYYVYKVANGMINISSKKGVPGSWINPADNKAPTSTTVKHTVKSGDTLSALAKKHNTTVASIQALNNMGKSTLIRVGQVLTIKK